VEPILTQEFGEVATAPSRIYLRVSGIDACHAAMEEAGTRILVAIEDRAYGLRDFRVADPSGHEIDFGESLGGEV
jgi:uncharacterized glyoxalase superfamily protein PhnB